MALGWLLLSRDFVNPLGKIVVECPRVRHAIRLLKGLDGGYGFRTKLACELLRREVAHRCKLILHVNNSVTFSLPGHQDPQGRKRSVVDEDVVSRQSRLRFVGGISKGILN